MHLQKFTLVLLSFIFCSNALANQVGCILRENLNEYFDRSHFSTPEVRASWDTNRFTNPALHSPQNFRYLVHTIDAAITDSLGGNPKPIYSVEKTFDFITKNVAQNACATISTSLINQDKMGTFGVVGFIIKVPEDNIIIASSRDIGSKSLLINKDHLLFNRIANGYAQRVPMATPEQVLLATENGDWNEVIVQGKFRESITITGILINYKNFQQGNLLRYQIQMVEDLKRLAAKKNLPVVILGEPFPF